MNRILHTPEGVRDIVGEKLRSRRELKNTMMACIESNGYEPIETPTFEYFDVFSSEIGTTPSKELYKFFDSEGHTIALRPDFTPSIARVSSRYFDNKTLRLCYEGNVFINHKSYQGRLKERAQLGAELIGTSNPASDAEIITLSVNCLKTAGLKDFTVSIGHTDIFKGLMEAADIKDDDINILRSLFTRKNIYGVFDFIKDRNLPTEIIDLYKTVLRTDTEQNFAILLHSLEKYDRLFGAVKYLIELKDLLKESDVLSYVAFDLSMLSRHDYYTGVIFSGYAFGSGAPIFIGGRYDNLLKNFGKDAPASGFSVFIDNIISALVYQDNNSNDKEYLTIALGKGRLAKSAMKLFERIGIECKEVLDKDTRKLIFVNEEKRIKFFLAKVPDVPTYVEYGAADIGIVGEDTVLEEGRDIYEVLDLGFGACKMCVCGLPEAKEILDSQSNIRVSTKYPVIAKDYFFNKKHITAEIIKLNGSIELAPILGLSDCIVDIVETGTTLKENGLKILEEVCDLSARVVVNKVSLKMQSKRISKIIDSLKEETDENN